MHALVKQMIEKPIYWEAAHPTETKLNNLQINV